CVPYCLCTVAAHRSVPLPVQTINPTPCGTICPYSTLFGSGPCGSASATSPTCKTVVSNTACIQVTKVCGPATIDVSAGSYTVSGFGREWCRDVMTGWFVLYVLSNTSDNVSGCSGCVRVTSM